jgi:surface polysaccharide O-acyltransferase-like enzyme
MTNNRKDWIDALRACAMLIVMIWHFSNNMPYQWLFNVFTAPIMIPLFFAITGYVFNGCDGNCTLFFSKLTKHLVLPWLLLAIIKGAFVALIRGSFDYYWEYFLNLFTGDNLWYFPCCIIAEILFFYTIKKFENCKKRILASMLLCIIGFGLSNIFIFKYLNISTAFICQIFLLIGALFKKIENSIGKEVKIGYLCISLFIFIGILVSTMPNPIGTANQISMDVHKNYYYNLFTVFTMIFFGILSVFILVKNRDEFPRWLTFVGRNTIVFYIFHYDTIMPLSVLTKHIGLNMESHWGYVFIKLFWSIIICSIIAICLNKWAPQLVGKRR